MTCLAILGGGSWGTALSIVLSRSPREHEISLWVHDPDLAEAMQKRRENKEYLPGQSVPKPVRITSQLEEALHNATIIVGAMPAAHARSVYTKALPFLDMAAYRSGRVSSVLVNTTKGLEPATHLRMSQVISEVFSNQFSPKMAVLSGPSFALEAARGEPTAVVLASQEKPVGLERDRPGLDNLAAELQQEFSAPGFRLYTHDDVQGVELAGAMKNVIAIAAGVCHGLGLGTNSLAALITRGLAEMTRLAVALGSRAETLSGLAGLGDLVLTCTGSLSRNRYVGIELAKGRALADILGGMRMVAEGVGTSAALLALAREAQVAMPITAQVDAILHQGQSPGQAIREIMERPLKRE